ncbi:hypothetical protein M431DRAFT_485275 [Trichoderma harzianum CBS 226.95]|uniref:Uncharacterized protein n=1 Tax=Trichoderma harzianum CBS 226.95 TaxID=983964 RepID=A0A2T4A304_TRIHA|nr:hypothetical protein M431DRAFT_485275 [Trichoderma harzianum CBS 226.95]PTB51429.1 hypothetical protein M431DRAFT_485275 [Trichoderma harzianum CBS 226.95]
MAVTKFLLIAIQLIGVLSTPIAEPNITDISDNKFFARSSSTVEEYPYSSNCDASTGSTFTWDVSHGGGPCYSYNGNTDVYSLRVAWSDYNVCNGNTAVIYMFHNGFYCGDFAQATRVYAGSNGNFCSYSNLFFSAHQVHNAMSYAAKIMWPGLLPQSNVGTTWFAQAIIEPVLFSACMDDAEVHMQSRKSISLDKTLSILIVWGIFSDDSVTISLFG